MYSTYVQYVRTYMIVVFPSLPVAYRAALLQKQGSVKAAVELLDVAVTASSRDPSLYMFRAALNEEVRTHAFVWSSSACVHLCFQCCYCKQAVLLINLTVCLVNFNTVGVFYCPHSGQPCNHPRTATFPPALLFVS